MENQRSKVFVPKKPLKRLTLKKNPGRRSARFLEKNTVTIAVDNKVKNVMELPEENEVKTTMELQDFDLLSRLPNEIFLKIMEYLSTSDILKRMAPVSKRFYQLSQDETIIKQIEFMTIVGLRWSDERKEKYYNDFFKVLKNSQKLKILTVDLDQNPVGNFYRNWIEAAVNLQNVEEFYIKIRNFKLEKCNNFLKYGVLDRCPKLKILKIIKEKMPKIQHFPMNPCWNPCTFYKSWNGPNKKKIFQGIEAEKEIKTEIWNESCPACGTTNPLLSKKADAYETTNFVFSRI